MANKVVGLSQFRFVEESYHDMTIQLVPDPQNTSMTREEIEDHFRKCMEKEYGDEFRVRRGKTGSMNEFTKGVYDLYSGDAAGAKHAFLQLAHSYPLDGGARYYLYLADRLEHDPSLPCVLNLDNADGGEV